jgi:1,4-alpha-glucan branching enzyme
MTNLDGSRTAGAEGGAPGFFSLVLHAHLPFVRHPEHDQFLEEDWLYEAITETYTPLLEMLEGWERRSLPAALSLTLSPTLCSMLLDPLLRRRYLRRLDGLIELAEKETHRTQWEPALNKLSWRYLERFQTARQTWTRWNQNLLAGFRHFQDLGWLEILTCPATHALLPLLAARPESMRAQVLVARDHYRSCFGRDPRGIWLAECAYAPGVEKILAEANLRWFITDTHGILQASPRPRFGVFAPVFTSSGVAAFGRDIDSSKQVWSRDGGYPGDPDYRDFYRDIAFDLDLDYLQPYLPVAGQRTFTGLKYYRITGPLGDKEVYDSETALRRAREHALHFLEARLRHLGEIAKIMPQPPIVIAPYDAELFGHWWYEGPEFLDAFFTAAARHRDQLLPITPGDYLRQHPRHQEATPAASSWGEEGYLRVWLNEKNEWIYPHLDIAAERMAALAGRHPQAEGLTLRALKQAGRELLLAQSSDWPFILRTGTNPDYASGRVRDHLLRFIALHEQLTTTSVDEAWLADLESRDNLFPDLDYRYWRTPTT